MSTAERRCSRSGGARAALPALGWLAAAAPVHAFDLQGHRGARGLAPENTLAAFDAALNITPRRLLAA